MDGMESALVIGTSFLGLASVVAAPLAVLLGLPLMAWLGRAWIRLRESEIELQKLEMTIRLREGLLIPTYVDPADPNALVAWARTRGELARLDG